MHVGIFVKFRSTTKIEHVEILSAKNLHIYGNNICKFSEVALSESSFVKFSWHVIVICFTCVIEVLLWPLSACMSNSSHWSVKKLHVPHFATVIHVHSYYILTQW